MSKVLKAYMLGLIAASIMVFSDILFDGVAYLMVCFVAGSISAKIVLGLDKESEE